MSKGICTEGDCGRTIYARGICSMHYQRGRLSGTLPMSPIRSLTDEQRFWYYTPKRGGYGCWNWEGPINSTTGYGSLRLVEKRSVTAHRFSYELLVGPIPEGLVTDHLCRNRQCVNPAHLEPVTLGTNTLRGIGPSATNARKTHCSEGHPFAGDNLVMYKNCRMCRTCKNATGRRLRAAKRAA